MPSKNKGQFLHPKNDCANPISPHTTRNAKELLMAQPHANETLLPPKTHLNERRGIETQTSNRNRNPALPLFQPREGAQNFHFRDPHLLSATSPAPIEWESVGSNASTSQLNSTLGSREDLHERGGPPTNAEDCFGNSYNNANQSVSLASQATPHRHQRAAKPVLGNATPRNNLRARESIVRFIEDNASEQRMPAIGMSSLCSPEQEAPPTAEAGFMVASWTERSTPVTLASENVGSGMTPMVEGSASDSSQTKVLPAMIPTNEKLSTNFFTQLLATLRRQANQKRRAFIVLALELLLPVLFVLVLLLLNNVISITRYPTKQFVVNNEQPVTFSTSRSFACYFEPFPADIKALGVRSCSIVGSQGGRIGCARRGLVPLDNYCVVNGGALTTFSLNVLQTGETQIEIPNLDDLVLSKWIWRMYIAGGTDLWNDGLIMSMRTNGRIYFTPNTQASQDIVAWLNARHTMFKYVFGGYFDSRSDATNFASRVENEGKVWAVIDIRDLSPTNLEFVIMTNHSGIPGFSTGPIDPSAAGKGDIPYNKWLASGFLTFQKMIQDWYLSQIHNVPSSDLNIEGPATDIVQVPMGVQAYRKSEFLDFGQTLGPLVIVMGYMFPVAQLAKRLVEEKEQRLREGTMIMGLTRAAFFSSWLIIYYTITSVCAFIVSGVLKLGVFTHSDYFVMAVTFILFGISSVSVSALISTFFSSAKIAAIVVPLLYFVMCVPGFVLPVNIVGAYHALSVLSPIAMSVAVRLLFVYEQTSGMQWSQISRAEDYPYPYVWALVWMAGMSVVYVVLLIYLDTVWPKQWGIRRHPLFIFMSQRKGGIWGSRKKPGVPTYNESQMPFGSADKPTSAFENVKGHRAAVEDYPLKEEATVIFKDLVKEFGDGKQVLKAVNKFNLKLFPDGITVLLGHNGAGKTTVMNMLTGMMPPTSGDVMIYGNNVTIDMEEIRRDIGFCPQHNILWDDLTCLEHLQYFARLKGLSGQAVDDEANDLLRRVDLLDKADVLSSNLSGGQKRKLSVAIAFMGRARLVLLDEPTAGMDVAARRHTWDVLKDMSQGRTILLTTHYMDEADLLGSRIAILSKGCLHSYGSPPFLKTHLGSGYVCRFGCQRTVDDRSANVILSEVRKIVPAAVKDDYKGKELSIQLKSGLASDFPRLIREFESPETKKRLKLDSFSITSATLESVFLNIANDEKNYEDANSDTHEHHRRAESTEAERQEAFKHLDLLYAKLFDRHCEKLSKSRTGRSITMDESQLAATTRSPDVVVNEKPELKKSSHHRGRQLGAMLAKRFHFARRDYCAIALAVIAPVICIILAMCIDLVNVGNQKLFWFENEEYKRPQMAVLSNCPYTQPVYGPSFQELQILPPSSTFAFSNYLLDTFYAHPYERMIGMYCNDALGNTVFFLNATALGAGPQALLELYNAKVRTSTGDTSVRMRVGSWPLPYTDREKSQVDSIKSILMALCILIPFSFVPATFVAFIVREKFCKSKHLQFVSGANFMVYWTANFIFDFLTFLLTAIIAICIFFAFSRDELIGTADRVGATLLLFLLFMLSGIGLSYLMSHFFTNYSTAQTMVMLFHLLTGFVLVIIMFFLDGVQSTHEMSKTLVYFFRIVPSYCLGDGLINLVKNRNAGGFALLYGDLGGPLAYDVTGWDLIYMGAQAVIFFTLAIIIDHPSWNRRRQMWQRNHQRLTGAVYSAAPGEFEDDDVALEREIVESGKRADDVVRVQRLRKEFDVGRGVKKYAVRNLSFGITPGEVFGFLGTNGAGKTTTMSMLTTELIPTCGNATVGGYDVVKDALNTRRLIGYCPQFDAIIDKLTPAEHLRLFAALRGLGSTDANLVLSALIIVCGLSEYRDVPAGKLSGGNKRKLSVAMALIGGPSIVFLDEPSAGMDPHARRQLWDVISFIAKHSSVLLTTHHLEEVDVLAHRVGIMDDGQMKCLGTLEHLKNKFGNGYELILMTDPSRGKCDTLLTNILEQTGLKESLVVEVCVSRITVSLGPDADIASIFERMQKIVSSGSSCIVDYIVQRASLEQVFMKISTMKAREQEALVAAKESNFRGENEAQSYCDEKSQHEFGSCSPSSYCHLATESACGKSLRILMAHEGSPVKHKRQLTATDKSLIREDSRSPTLGSRMGSFISVSLGASPGSALVSCRTPASTIRITPGSAFYADACFGRERFKENLRNALESTVYGAGAPVVITPAMVDDA